MNVMFYMGNRKDINLYIYWLRMSVSIVVTNITTKVFLNTVPDFDIL